MREGHEAGGPPTAAGRIRRGYTEPPFRTSARRGARNSGQNQAGSPPTRGPVQARGGGATPVPCTLATSRKTAELFPGSLPPSRGKDKAASIRSRELIGQTTTIGIVEGPPVLGGCAAARQKHEFL